MSTKYPNYPFSSLLLFQSLIDLWFWTMAPLSIKSLIRESAWWPETVQIDRRSWTICWPLLAWVTCSVKVCCSEHLSKKINLSGEFILMVRPFCSPPQPLYTGQLNQNSIECKKHVISRSSTKCKHTLQIDNYYHTIKSLLFFFSSYFDPLSLILFKTVAFWTTSAKI